METDRMNKTIRVNALNGIGDAIFATGPLAALREKYPESEIIVYCSGRDNMDVFKYNPNASKVARRTLVSEVLWYLRDKLMPSLSLSSNYGWLYPSLTYDRSAPEIIAELFGVKLGPHQPKIYLSKREHAEGIRAVQGLKGPLVAIHTSGRCTANKNWQGWKWAELVSRNPDFTFIQLGCEGEGRVRGSVDKLGLALRQSFALLAQCDAFVGIESSLCHAATGLGVGCVVLFGASSTVIAGHKSNINLTASLKCSPCIDILLGDKCPFENACMNAISVDQVNACLPRVFALGEKNKLTCQVFDHNI